MKTIQDNKKWERKDAHGRQEGKEGDAKWQRESEGERKKASKEVERKIKGKESERKNKWESLSASSNTIENYVFCCFHHFNTQ